jgi:2-polyprenyl-3-methyl-5-hydroxy-6-metoxy-1,4-benzoquinol methylase
VLASDAAVDADDTLVLTGERTLPGIAVENYWFRRHEAAYAAVAPFTRGAVVVEAGCGEGYGAERLARIAHRVLAVDYDATTVGHASRTYGRIDVARANLVQLPFADGSVDAVVCLQVIEHLWDQPAFIAECARVLAPSGTLALSTPNRLTFSPGAGPDDPPLNPFHTRELTASDLGDLVAPHFAVTRMYGVHHARRIARFERRHGSLVAAQVAGAPDTWPGPVRRFVPTVRAADFVVAEDHTRTPVDACLDLLAVAHRRTGVT